MLYRIGTVSEIPLLGSKFPDQVIHHLQACTALLDTSYGATRNYFEEGGYSILIETPQDLCLVDHTISLQEHPCEWVDLLSGQRDFLAALYLMNDDYSIVVYMPLSIAPHHLLQELNA